MVPCLLEAHYKPMGYHTSVRTVFTIHNLKYQGIHGVENIADLMDMPPEYLTEDRVLKDGVPNFMKAGIVYADAVTTVSPTYADEILTTRYGEGLDGVLRQYSHKIRGILNGIDTVEFDPASDPCIPRNYGPADRREGKAVNKRHLQAELGLDDIPDAPLAVMVTRLVDQKGLDLLIHAVDGIVGEGCQLVVQGTGDPFYEWVLAEAAARHPGRMAAALAYDNALAHRVYAAGDLFLMPSLFEPCGLSQMIAMRYGTVPVVRETGGLKDTVRPYDPASGGGNGFTFAETDGEGLLRAVRAACALYRDSPVIWDSIAVRDMRGDFTWDRSAAEYAALFSRLAGKGAEPG
ncbi:MAG: glycogen synthase, partial [Clostridia bacterium]|nr:glycogen synthase [Clostridia bacterium]